MQQLEALLDSERLKLADADSALVPHCNEFSSRGKHLYVTLFEHLGCDQQRASQLRQRQVLQRLLQPSFVSVVNQNNVPRLLQKQFQPMQHGIQCRRR